MPTVDAIVEGFFARPDVVERMKPAEIAFAAFMKNMERHLKPLGEALLAVAKLPPSPGYEPLLRQGADLLLARMMARLLVRRGKRIEEENLRHRSVVGAVRFLAKPGRRRSSIALRARALLAAWDETSTIESIFRSAARDSVTEFAAALKGAVTGDIVACERVTAIAGILLPVLSNPPGPKISAASASHEFLLETLAWEEMSHGYTWSEVEGDFMDELTLATRREFADPDFDPRPAYRRLKKRGKTKTRRSRRRGAPGE